MVGPDGVLPLPWLAEPLRAALGTARAHHAVLLHGPPGVGQFEFATTLAQAWLCEAEAGEGRPRPCGLCAACRLVQARTHPDLQVLLPEAQQAALGWLPASDSEGGEGGEGRASERKPKQEIVVEQVRQLLAFAQLSASRGRLKVAVIHPAERLNAISGNTLLKTLEEPPGDARFILATGDPAALLPTVRSRCQPLHLPAPDAAQAREWLAAQGVAQPEVLLRATGGRPLEARDWAGEGIDAQAWLRLPECVGAGDPSVLAAWPLPRVVETLQKLCHDALLATLGQPARYFPSLRAQAAAPALHRWASSLQRAAAQAEHPLNAALAVQSLVLQGQRALAPAAATAGR